MRELTKGPLKRLLTWLFSKHGALAFAGAIAFVGAIFIIVSIYIPAFNDWSWKLSDIAPRLAADYGGFVGGIAGALFALVAAILLFLNFKSQEKSAARQSFESRFFEMIRLHRENVAEMSHKSPYEAGGPIETGRRVFLSMQDQYRDIYEICKEIAGNKFDTEDIANISYLFFFFGVGQKSLVMLRPYLERYNEGGLFDRLVDQLREIKTNYSDDIVRFGGHQLRLGHYYRHMFQSVKFVDSNRDLNLREKQGYVKMLRAQLSTTEQAIFFYNSISRLGRKWRSNGYVERYELIKNLPPHFVEPLDPKEYYANIKFEYEED